MRRTARWGLLAMVIIAGCSSDPAPRSADSGSSAAPSSTRSSAPRAALLYPNANLTPGATIADLTVAKVCADDYVASVGEVAAAVRDQVFASYGLAGVNRDDYELDHLVPLELGGSNDITNLWPETMHDPGGNGAFDKDLIEGQLRDAVCAKKLALADAQAAILHWDTVNLALLVPTTTTAPKTTIASGGPPTTQHVPTTTAPEGPPTTKKK